MFLISEADKLKLDEYKSKLTSFTCPTTTNSVTEMSKVEEMDKTLQELRARYENLISSTSHASAPQYASTPNVAVKNTPIVETGKIPTPPPTYQTPLDKIPHPSQSKDKHAKCKQKLADCYSQLEKCRIQHWQKLNGSQYSSNTDTTKTPLGKKLTFSEMDTTPAIIAVKSNHKSRPKRLRHEPQRLIL